MSNAALPGCGYKTLLANVTLKFKKMYQLTEKHNQNMCEHQVISLRSNSKGFAACRNSYLRVQAVPAPVNHMTFRKVYFSQSPAITVRSCFVRTKGFF